MVHTSASEYSYWAELVTINSELWSKGLSGAPLTTTEAEEFDAMAQAWHMNGYAGYFGTSEIGRAGIGSS
jgi:hypothetical protein